LADYPHPTLTFPKKVYSFTINLFALFNYRLFKQIPHAKGYFEKFKDEPEENLKQSDELKFHVGKMMDSLNVLVGNLGNKEFLVTETQTIARDHKNRSVTSQDFKVILLHQF
jgi:hypothetical protein